MNTRAFAKLSPQSKVVERVEHDPATGCWLWTGTLSAGGYGVIGGRKNKRYAHRFAWEAWRGLIPEGMHLDHKCRTRRCVNPSHLRIVTPRQNALENSASVAAKNAKKPRCGTCGGKFTVKSNGGRYCAACKVRKEKVRKDTDPDFADRRRAYHLAYYHAHPELKARKR